MTRHDPINYLQLFFDKDIVNFIIEKTNEYVVNLFLAERVYNLVLHNGKILQ